MTVPPALALLLALLLAGCNRYAEFRLPAPPGEPASLRWEWSAEPAPVLTRGMAGSWDAVDALNPSIVRRPDGYWNYYSGFDGEAWRTGLAVSPDGIRWTRRGVVLSPDPESWEGGYIAANGTTLLLGNETLHWYQAGPKGSTRIGLARSEDGIAFHKHPGPVLETGPRGSWDERSIGDPYVLATGGELYMYYLGEDRARRQRLGVARSTDGVRWWKLRSNPVLELGPGGAFDENGLGEPALWTAHGYYWMIYTGRDRSEHRRLGLARSRDGIVWERIPGAFAGAEDWNRKVICDPEIEVTPDGVRVWFGGGDAASPDERLNGQIGLALLREVREEN